MKKNFFSEIINKSLYTKIVLSIFFTLIIVIFFVEVANFYVLKLYKKRVEATYQNSLKLYGNYWDSLFEVINKTLVTTISSDNNIYFDNITYSNDKLTYETSKVILEKKLNEIVHTYNHQIYSFIYFENNNEYINSSNNIVQYDSRKELKNGIINYITNVQIINDNKWEVIKNQNSFYFIQSFKINKGYIGAIIKLDDILYELVNNEEIVGQALILDNNNEIVYRLDSNLDINSDSPIYKQKIEKSNYKIGITVSKARMFNEQVLFLLIIVGILILGIVIILIDIQLQKRIVINPLSKLKKAMNNFRNGDMNYRIKDKAKSVEIQTLYDTFNTMANQINNLKINIYESKLENQEIWNDFLRLQIQPHFYTNILNLICGFAQIENCKQIQHLSTITSQYFRYLLSTKNKLIAIEDEIECVKTYVEIQKIRYPDSIVFNYKNKVKDLMIPPLLLQTFVENSIVHNITLVPVLKIEMIIKEKDKDINITIKDNGTGFSPEIIKKLDNNESISVEGKHIGIENVKKRLEMIYGENAILKIQSIKGCTKVSIQILKK